MITSGQLRAARALIRWDQKVLAEESKVSLSTIKRVESQEGPVDANQTTIDALQRALETAGVEFIPENGLGPGVRLKKKAQTSEQLMSAIADLHEALPTVDKHAKASPDKAMKQLERAHGKNEITKAKNKQTKLTGKGAQTKS